MNRDDEKTPAETPKSILREIAKLSEITQRVSDYSLEIQGDIRLLFERLDRLDTRLAVTFGIACAGLAVALVSLVR